MLYGRDVAGTCVNWQGASWSCKEWERLSVLIGALGQAGFRVVFAFPSEGRSIHEIIKQEDACRSFVPKTMELSAENAREFDTFIDESYPKFKPEPSSSKPDSKFPEYYTNLKHQSDALNVFKDIHDAVMEECKREADFAEFLYAVCLFRQSRRPSALFYEAVQQCQNRFNVNGIDNDLQRSRRAIEWVSFLEKNRVFYKKAGGHSWMHRDIRLALRRSLDNQIVERTANPSAFCHRLARMHFWIGDWYEKAFLATGFAKPMLECLHHRFQSALMSVYSIPSDLLDRKDSKAIQRHRAMIFRYSVIAMTKSLLVSRQYLKLWLANIHGFGMFEGESKNFAMEKLEQVAEQLQSANGLPDIDAIVEEFKTMLIETDRSIRREADLSYSGYAIPMSVQNPASTLKEKVRKQLDAVLGATYKQASAWDSELEGLFRSTRQQFPIECVHLLRDSMSIDVRDTKRKFNSSRYARSKGLAIDRLAMDFGKLLPFLCLIEGLAYAQLRRAKYRSHESAGGPTPSSLQIDVRIEWLKVTRLCHLGIDWCKHLRVGCFAMDCELRVRMLSYYAVALANLDRFFEAHRRINEANGINSKRELPASHVEMAKLSIRRAEVLLTEAHRLTEVLAVLRDNENKVAWLTVKGSTKPENFRCLFTKKNFWVFDDTKIPEDIGDESRNRMRLHPSAKLIQPLLLGLEDDCRVKVCLHPSAVECIPDVAITPKVYQASIDSLVRLLVATLDDAWFTIENAERLLSGRSQSSLWWGRIALMKLRAFGYQAHVFGPDGYEEMRMLAYRHRRINPQFMIRIFENAMLNNGTSLYRELRLIRYMAMCLVSFAKCGDDLERLRDMSEDLQRRLELRRSQAGEMDRIFELAEEGFKTAQEEIARMQAESRG
jgi:hypothetical protein